MLQDDYCEFFKQIALTTFNYISQTPIQTCCSDRVDF